MFTENIYKTLRKYKDDLENKGYNVLYIGLFGSQNYNLHDEDSDIDAKAIVLPNLRDVVRRKVTSKVYQYDTGEVDVKDIITFNDVIRKGNPAYVEVVHSKYSIGDKTVRELFQNYKINPQAALGMAYEKLAAMRKGLPKSSPMIEKIGYDPKQLHHIVRLHDLFASTLFNKLEEIVPIKEYHDQGRRFMLKLKREGVAHNKQLFRNDAIIEGEELIDYIKKATGRLSYSQVDIDEELLNLVEQYLTVDFFKGGKNGLTARPDYWTEEQVEDVVQGFRENYKDNDRIYTEELREGESVENQLDIPKPISAEVIRISPVAASLKRNLIAAMEFFNAEITQALEDYKTHIEFYYRVDGELSEFGELMEGMHSELKDDVLNYVISVYSDEGFKAFVNEDGGLMFDWYYIIMNEGEE